VRWIGTALLVAIAVVSGCDEADRPKAAEERLAEIAQASAVDLRMAGCRTDPVRGAGSMVVNSASGDGYILTAAHVVAGSRSILARPATGGGPAVEAVLMAIDPANDLALLASELALPALPLAELTTGDEGVAIIFRDRVTTVQPFSIVNPAIVNIVDIYGENKISRPGYRVAIDIDPGDSGAVLVGPGGTAAGSLWGRTLDGDGTAFATNTSAIDALFDAAAAADPVAGIPTGRCP